jgi:predicted metalloprotease
LVSKTHASSQAYLIAHEIRHHVQNLLGVLPKVLRAQSGKKRPTQMRCKFAWSCKQIALLAFG